MSRQLLLKRVLARSPFTDSSLALIAFAGQKPSRQQPPVVIPLRIDQPAVDVTPHPTDNIDKEVRGS
jgi:hypothetical protein